MFYLLFLYCNLSLRSLVMDSRTLLATFQQSHLVHMFREGNCCADSLARMGGNPSFLRNFNLRSSANDFVVYFELPSFMCSFVNLILPDALFIVLLFRFKFY